MSLFSLKNISRAWAKICIFSRKYISHRHLFSRARYKVTFFLSFCQARQLARCEGEGRKSLKDLPLLNVLFVFSAFVYKKISVANVILLWQTPSLFLKKTFVYSNASTSASNTLTIRLVLDRPTYHAKRIAFPAYISSRFDNC